MRLLGVDFESQTDDAGTTPITEIGARVCEVTPSGAWALAEHYSTLVYHPGYPPQTAEIVDLTGITDEMLKKDGIEPKAAMPRLLEMIGAVDYVLAYNKSFDETVCRSLSKRIALTMPETEWICVLNDLPWPGKFPCRRLSHLAFDLEVEFDRANLHRALDDVDLMFAAMFKQFTWDQVFAYHTTPWKFVEALIPAPWTDKGVGKEQARKRGYGWEKAKGTESPVFSKSWVKRIKADQLELEIKQAPFKVVVLEGFV